MFVVIDTVFEGCSLLNLNNKRANKVCKAICVVEIGYGYLHKNQIKLYTSAKQRMFIYIWFIGVWYIYGLRVSCAQKDTTKDLRICIINSFIRLEIIGSSKIDKEYYAPI